MTNTSNTLPIAIDDKYWVVSFSDSVELRNLIQDRRIWVRNNAKVIDEAGIKIDAELADHFVMIFSKAEASSAVDDFVVEGIHRTALVSVRMLSKQTVQTLGHVSHTIDVYYQLLGESGPWVFSSHMEIGRDPATITDFIFGAVTDPGCIVAMLNDPANTIQIYEVDAAGTAVPSSKATGVRFMLPSGKTPSVVFSGHQPDPLSDALPLDIACNPVFGTAQLNGQILDLTVDSIVVKAYV